MEFFSLWSILRFTGVERISKFFERRQDWWAANLGTKTGRCFEVTLALAMKGEMPWHRSSAEWYVVTCGDMWWRHRTTLMTWGAGIFIFVQLLGSLLAALLALLTSGRPAFEREWFHVEVTNWMFTVKQHFKIFLVVRYCLPCVSIIWQLRRCLEDNFYMMEETMASAGIRILLQARQLQSMIQYDLKQRDGGATCWAEVVLSFFIISVPLWAHQRRTGVEAEAWRSCMIMKGETREGNQFRRSMAVPVLVCRLANCGALSNPKHLVRTSSERLPRVFFRRKIRSSWTFVPENTQGFSYIATTLTGLPQLLDVPNLLRCFGLLLIGIRTVWDGSRMGSGESKVNKFSNPCTQQCIFNEVFNVRSMFLPPDCVHYVWRSTSVFFLQEPCFNSFLHFLPARTTTLVFTCILQNLSFYALNAGVDQNAAARKHWYLL